MILTDGYELNLNARNSINLAQRVDVKCDECGHVYESVLRNREFLFKKYYKDRCRSCALKFQYANNIRVSKISEYNIAQTGKTFEQRLGEASAKAAKNKLSIANSGENNAMFGRNDQCHGINKFNTERKGKTYVETYGEEKASSISKKLSLASSGENNGMFGKPSPEGSGNGWSGKYKKIYFRSILELSYLKYLFDNDIEFVNGEIKEFAISYMLDGKNRNYFCDFVIGEKYIELKPLKLISTYANTQKFKAAREKHGDNFIILTESDVKLLCFKEIEELVNNGDLVFDERYLEKFLLLKGKK